MSMPTIPTVPTIVTLAESIVESSGTGLATRLLAMPRAELHALRAHNLALNYFKDMSFHIGRWTQKIQELKRSWDYLRIAQLAAENPKSVAFHSALGRMAAQEAALQHGARIAAANAAASAAEGTLVAGAGTTVAAIVIPVVGMVAVQFALGAGIYEARKKAKEEEFASGFARGFITGLLNWELRFTIDRFWDNAVGRNGFDDDMPSIRAKAHNEGLIMGRIAGLAKDESLKKSYLEFLKKLSTASAAGWTSRSDNWNEQMRARRVQINYVIELAVAARRYGVLAVE